MAWQTLTENDVFPRQAEMNVVREAEIPEGSSAEEVFAHAISQEVGSAWGYLRAAVAKGYLSALGPAGTLPSTLVGPVAVLVRRAVIARIPTLGTLLHDEIREDEVKDAQRLIRDVATGNNRVPEHDVAEPEVAASPIIEATAAPRQATREKLKGL